MWHCLTWTLDPQKTPYYLSFYPSIQIVRGKKKWTLESSDMFSIVHKQQGVGTDQGEVSLWLC